MSNESNPLHDLEGDGLLVDSAPYAVLSVQGTDQHKDLQRLLEKYGLERRDSKLPGVFHLVCRQRRDGQHKMQAVILFVAGIEIHKTSPLSHLHLGEVSQLHQGLHEALHGAQAASPHTADSHIERWLQEMHPFSLEAVTTWHLNQAGFPVPRLNAGVMHLTKPHVERLHRHLFNQAVEKNFLTLVQRFNAQAGDDRESA